MLIKNVSSMIFNTGYLSDFSSLKGEEYSDGSLQQSVEIRTISAILASDSIALENGETHGFEARHMDGVSRRHKQ